MRNFIYCCICCFWFSSAWAQSQQIATQKDLIYRRVGDWDGKLDLYAPLESKSKPLVVYVHGGGWVHGTKDAEYEKIKVFIENGYAVANVEYRLAKQAPAPAAVQDVQCALQFLTSQSKKLNLEARSMVIMGASAGAHLALLVGLQSTLPQFDNECGNRFIRVKGIISKYGPTDLSIWEPAFKTGSASAAWLGDKVKDTLFVKSLSPINYTNLNKIPVLVIHGTEDQTVPISQSEMLYERLKQNGHPTEFHRVVGGKHGNFTPEATEIMNQKMLVFLKEISDH